MTNKYHAKKTQIGGVWFDSKAEGMHYLLLKDRQRKGEIIGLSLQPKFALIVNGHAVGTYTPDFGYIEGARAICEDTKGVRTEAFMLRARLFMALYPDIELRINGLAAKKPKPPKLPGAAKRSRSSTPFILAKINGEAGA